MTKLHRLSILLSNLLSLTFVFAVHGQIKLAGLPAQQEAQEAAFVDAWIAFRREMDGITSLKRHPDLVDAWLGAMPDYLLVDVLRLATDREIVYEAARSLMKRGGAPNVAAVVTAAESCPNASLGDQLRMVLVSSGHQDTVRALLKQLEHPIASTRLHAAVILAGGGDHRGINYLKNQVERTTDGALAAIALGRFASPEERHGIDRVIERHPLQNARRAALGEMIFRRRFREVYRLFLKQHRFDRSGYTEGGLYETWMEAVQMAAKENIKDSGALKAYVSQSMREPPFHRDSETVRRQLTLFFEFLENASALLEGASKPPWPTKFEDAVTQMSVIHSRELDPDTLTAGRISAAIAVIAATGKTVGYPRLAMPTPGVRALSASGERTLDGNLATSWQFKQQGRLVIEHLKSIFLKNIHMVAACPMNEGRPPKGALTVEVSGRQRASAWKIRQQLSPHRRFFQQIPVEKVSDGRIILVVTAEDTQALSCVPEIRLELAGAAEK